MEDARHINLTDENGQVYCHLQGKVAPFDGVHVAEVCWGCPYWGGLAGGYGVECVYDDPGARTPEVKYTKPAAAQAEAPEPVEDKDSVASAAGKQARDARLELYTPAAKGGEEYAEEEGAEETAPAEEGAPAPAAEEEGEEMELAEGAAAPPAKQPAAAPPAAKPLPANAKKKPFPPAAKSRLAEVLTEVVKERISPS